MGTEEQEKMNFWLLWLKYPGKVLLLFVVFFIALYAVKKLEVIEIGNIVKFKPDKKESDSYSTIPAKDSMQERRKEESDNDKVIEPKMHELPDSEREEDNSFDKIPVLDEKRKKYGGIKEEQEVQDNNLGIYEPELKNALKESMDRLTTLINDCVQKDIDKPTKEYNIKLMMMEVDENAEMEVSSLYGKTRTMKIRDYFTDLVYLREKNNYSDIHFKFFNIRILRISYLSEGTYLAEGEYTQTFEAFRNGRVVYSDITMKLSEILAVKEPRGWKTKLRDTRVLSTYPILKNE